jgi:SAM-dependent methyltransferase
MLSAALAERTLSVELLDKAPLAEAAGNLRDMRRLNRWFGPQWILAGLLRELGEGREPFSVLDVGAGAGDLSGWMRRAYPRAQVTALDRRPEHLKWARQEQPDGSTCSVAADARWLPFRDSSYDVTLCCTLLHHFSDEEAARLLRDMMRVARKAVVVIDLMRSRFAHGFLPATRWLFRWHAISLYDGPRSVAAAYRTEELKAVAREAGLGAARVRAHWPWCRLSLVAWRGTRGRRPLS